MHVLCPLHASAERHFGPSLVSFFYGGVLNLDIEMRVMHSQRGKPMWLGGGGVGVGGGRTFCRHSSASKAVIDHPTVAEKKISAEEQTEQHDFNSIACNTFISK